MINEENLIEAAKKLSLVAKDLKQTSAVMNQQSQSTLAALAELHRNHKQLLSESGSILREQARLGIGAAMREQLDVLEKRVKNLCADVDHTTTRMQHATTAVKKQARMALWSILAATGFGLLTIIGFTAWYWK